jgi:hypothetical protein
MEERLSDTLAALGSIAAEQGWKTVADLVTSIPDADDEEILVLAPDGVRSDAWCEWAQQVVPGSTLSTAELVESSQDRASVVLPNRIVVLLDWGRLLTTAAVEAASTVAARPLASRRFVIVGADAFRDGDDLASAERGLWRLVVGDPGTDWAGQDIGERGCVFWAPRPLGDPLDERVDRDRSALTAWLRTAEPVTPELNRMRVEIVLDTAEEAVQQDPAGTAGSLPIHPDSDVARLRERLTRLRRRLLTRLDADTESVARTLCASLQTFELDLLSDVDAHLSTHQPEFTSAAAVKSAVISYLSDRVATWSAGARELVDRRGSEIARETDAMFDGIDWQLVNHLVGSPTGATYPDTFRDAMTSVAAPDPTYPRAPFELVDGPHLPESRSFAVTMRTAMFGGLVAASASLLLGPVLIPAAAAGALGALGAGSLDRRFADRRTATAARDYARAVIAGVIGTAMSDVRANARALAGPIHDALRSRFAELDASLAAVESTQAIEAGPQTGPSVEAKLQAMREQGFASTNRE